MVGLTIGGWLAADVAKACSCVSGLEKDTVGDIRRAVSRADAVFEGVVREVSAMEGLQERAVLDVRRIWKGELGAQVTIVSWCLYLHKGDGYVVFANRNAAGVLGTGACGYTSGILEAQPVIEVLGDGRLAPRADGQSCAIGGEGAAGSIVLGMLFITRRRLRAGAGARGRGRE